jgi:glycerol-3-phosphate dehydrogenase
VGGGVVGAAVALALARRSVATALLEAEEDLALGASGSNSGILHTGFDSPPGELETSLILRSAQLRERLLSELAVTVMACGALLEPRDDAEARTVRGLAETARRNGVRVRVRDDGSLEVPGEAVTDPVAYTRALARAAAALGAEIRTSAPVAAVEGGERVAVRTASGESVACDVVVNCAGLRADEIARLMGEESFEVYPRKGEFFVFEPPEGRLLERILLPVPTKRTKGVLVFPTIDGKVVAGPTAHDQDDKRDRTVRAGAREEVMDKAAAMLPVLAGAEPIASYAGLRPAGRGVNYLIGRSRANPALINVAAIRSTGLSASLGIGEHVAALVAECGVALGREASLPTFDPEPASAAATPWWRRAGERRPRVA